MSLEEELKQLLWKQLNITTVRPENWSNETPLFDGTLGLDSLDAVEVVMVLKKHYGIRIQNRNQARDAFYSLYTLAEFVRQKQAEEPNQV
jgi:acyl carrier protein